MRIENQLSIFIFEIKKKKKENGTQIINFSFSAFRKNE